MSDVHDKSTRSYNMSRIRGKNTTPEIVVRKYLFSHGLRYRIHNKSLPGKPDIILPRFKTILFINGCFWHGHKNCKYFRIPKTRKLFWVNKIENNIKRDFRNIHLLKDKGWNVIVIYECELKGEKKESTLSNVFYKINENYKKV